MDKRIIYLRHNICIDPIIRVRKIIPADNSQAICISNYIRVIMIDICQNNIMIFSLHASHIIMDRPPCILIHTHTQTHILMKCLLHLSVLCPNLLHPYGRCIGLMICSKYVLVQFGSSRISISPTTRQLDFVLS